MVTDTFFEGYVKNRRMREYKQWIIMERKSAGEYATQWVKDVFENKFPLF
jgi:hypothetical protein